uniref:Uncharacterized protein n=1 Tax=Megaviridae environmental sample TaxID=1737588 RepID=A0A5J6VK43_9VIRU|nr:MAG: hypothetical protein [Megaviridae environmental sample]
MPINYDERTNETSGCTNCPGNPVTGARCIDCNCQFCWTCIVCVDEQERVSDITSRMRPGAYTKIIHLYKCTYCYNQYMELECFNDYQEMDSHFNEFDSAFPNPKLTSRSQKDRSRNKKRNVVYDRRLRKGKL